MARIQLLCDQKWRDLPNLTVIKLELERLGHTVLITATKDALPMIKVFRPDCVVFNHLFGQRYRELAAALRAASVAVVLLPTEGMTHPKALSLLAGENADYGAADLILPWNGPVADLIKERWDFDDSVVRPVGCTRFDFYDPQFTDVVEPRDEFCRRFGFNAGKPIVTWATQYVFAHLAEPSPARERFLQDTNDFGLRTFFRRQGLEAEDVPAMHAEARDAAAAAVAKLIDALPDVQIILKPHPAEDQRYYREMIPGFAQNIRLCPQDYIWNVLNASDVHLHRHCTTAVEAWNWDKPTIEMAMNSRHDPWPDRERGSDMAESGEQLIEQVKGYIEGASVDPERVRLRRAYVAQWFGGDRGKRCARAAVQIDVLMRARGRRRNPLSPLRGVPVSARQTVTAAARYALGMRPNQSLLSRQAANVLDPRDKMITRDDVRAYARLVKPALARVQS